MRKRIPVQPYCLLRQEGNLKRTVSEYSYGESHIGSIKFTHAKIFQKGRGIVIPDNIIRYIIINQYRNIIEIIEYYYLLLFHFIIILEIEIIFISFPRGLRVVARFLKKKHVEPPAHERTFGINPLRRVYFEFFWLFQTSVITHLRDSKLFYEKELLKTRFHKT